MPQVLTPLPEPDRWWIRYAPRRWGEAPRASTVWADLATGRLGKAGEGGGEEGAYAGLIRDLPGEAFDDVVYLPPVAERARAACDRLARELAAGGTPVLVQRLPGEEAQEVEGVVAVFDLLDCLLAEDLDELSRLPADAVVVWPLIAGVTDDADLVEEGLERLVGAGARVVQALVLELSPEERRALAETRGEEAFAALFHGPTPEGRAFARQAASKGLAPFLRRPLPRLPLQGAAEREAAGLLALAGELRLRMGEAGKSQEHLRATRFLDRSRLDLRDLARRGNLGILPWLDPVSLEIVAEWAATGESLTVERLLAQYCAVPQAPALSDAEP